ncbi:baseplate J/gp47 family protein [Paraburkholderia adhaesiva]|uniref:baseplate J/gp47 family protein n=1 Tax=Paraburkholderia adhaesiva TaxID=2883244 RepID=UPI001F16D651|nr:baseplate J/gp47 family protein [Paraburkholderia adhaesiva]
MPFNRPNLKTLIGQAESDIEAELPGTTARVRRSNLNVLAMVLAGAVNGLYGYFEFIFKQFFPWSATGWWLQRWAAWWGVTRKAAVAATGYVVFTGQADSAIALGTVLQYSGVEYTTTASASIPATGQIAVPVVAGVTGTTGIVAAGAQLTLTTPVTGVDSQATVDADGIANGSDTETDDDLRARLMRRVQKRPQGGDADDYVDWALEVAGVTRAWCVPVGNGMGTVVVYFMRDDDPDPIPNAAAVAAVYAYIESVRPVTAELWVVAPRPRDVDYAMSITPDTPEIRTAVIDELDDLHHRDAEPGAELLISHIRAAISNAAGLNDYTLTTPDGNVVVAQYEIPMRGKVTWA